MTLKQGIYVGAQPVTLSTGQPVHRGMQIVVDSRGEDAYLLPLLACVSDAKPGGAKRKPRNRRQETSS